MSVESVAFLFHKLQYSPVNSKAAGVVFFSDPAMYVVVFINMVTWILLLGN